MVDFPDPDTPLITNIVCDDLRYEMVLESFRNGKSSSGSYADIFVSDNEDTIELTVGSNTSSLSLTIELTVGSITSSFSLIRKTKIFSKDIMAIIFLTH